MNYLSLQCNYAHWLLSLHAAIIFGCFPFGEDVVLLSNEEVIFIGSATRKGSIVCL